MELPHNIEAEQQLIGALMLNNDIYDRVSGKISARSFYEPVHAAIYAAIVARIEAGVLASPVTLSDDMRGHAGLDALGGAKYLARMAGCSVSGYAAPSYADTIAELHNRRSLIRIADNLRGMAASRESAAADALREAEGALYSLAEGDATASGPVSFATAVTEAVTGAMERHQTSGGLRGIPTGLIDLDRKVGGFGNSDLVILAGRPSMGKTALAVNIGFRMAKAGKSVAIFSLEMSRDQLASRVICDAAELSGIAANNGQFTDDEARRYIEAGRDIASLPIVIDHTPAITVASLAQRARRLKRTTGLDFLIVDYLQLMRGSDRGAGNRVQEVSEITMGLKAIAKDLGIPVLALSQLSRQLESREDKRPQLSDLRESGSIEQDADIVLFVYREEYYLERQKPKDETGAEYADWLARYDLAHGKADVIVGKNRHGGIGAVDLAFEAQFTRFSNLAK